MYCLEVGNFMATVLLVCVIAFLLDHQQGTEVFHCYLFWVAFHWTISNVQTCSLISVLSCPFIWPSATYRSIALVYILSSVFIRPSATFRSISLSSVLSCVLLRRQHCTTVFHCHCCELHFIGPAAKSGSNSFSFVLSCVFIGPSAMYRCILLSVVSCILLDHQ